jgi:hypothetical protein
MEVNFTKEDIEKFMYATNKVKEVFQYLTDEEDTKNIDSNVLVNIHEAHSIFLDMLIAIRILEQTKE